jgi:hypothetical protein
VRVLEERTVIDRRALHLGRLILSFPFPSSSFHLDTFQLILECCVTALGSTFYSHRSRSKSLEKKAIRFLVGSGISDYLSYLSPLSSLFCLFYLLLEFLCVKFIPFNLVQFYRPILVLEDLMSLLENHTEFHDSG